MGKRSGFPKIHRSLYETWDPRAIKPLLPHLKPRTRFAEPFCGNFALVRQLEAAGHKLYWASDIEDRSAQTVINGVQVRRQAVVADALTLTDPLQRADCVISNCPWEVEQLHPIIEHLLANAKYTWLLLGAGWMFSQRAAPYMKFCSDIVTVGRLKWIPGTKWDAQDDCVWLRFAKDTDYTIFHPRLVSAKPSGGTSEE